MRNYEDNARNDEFARSGQFEGDSRNAEKTKRKNEPRLATYDDSKCNNEQGLRKVAKEIINNSEISDQQLIHLLYEERNWQGLLPDPDSFNKYDKSVRDEMIKWNTKRIDSDIAFNEKMLNDFSKNNKISTITNAIVYLGSIFAAIFAFIYSDFNPIALSILSVPAGSFCFNVYIENKKIKRINETEKDDEDTNVHNIWKSK